MIFEKQVWMQRAGEFPQSDSEYFNLMSRAIFSAGLGSHVIESRWDAITAVFYNFDPHKIDKMDADDVTRLLDNSAIIRNQRKIEAVIKNASIFTACTKEYGSFRAYLDTLGASSDLETTAKSLGKTFVHLGQTSALLFLFSAGWRPQENTRTKKK